MTAGGKATRAALARYRWGTVLIWCGVLTWVPFILLRIAGEKPSLFWYLPFHLAGVIGGSRLRSFARREMMLQPAKRNLWRILGHGLIWAGIGAWVPYFYLKMVAGPSVNVMNYLPYHLTGILGGILTLGVGHLIDQRRLSKP
ncbi:MAG TPA: hypothetical protein VLT51_15460 [Anaerolineales bacterium]|nr:hypothetical protein [Anaerolineales bacterium]